MCQLKTSQLVTHCHRQLILLCDTSGANDQDNLTCRTIRQLCVPQTGMSGSRSCKNLARMSKFSSILARVIVVLCSMVKTRVNLNACLRRSEQVSLWSLASRAKMTQSMLIKREFLAMLTLRYSSKVIHQAVVKTRMCVASGGFHLKDVFLNAQQRRVDVPLSTWMTRATCLPLFYPDHTLSKAPVGSLIIRSAI